MLTQDYTAATPEERRFYRYVFSKAEQQHAFQMNVLKMTEICFTKCVEFPSQDIDPKIRDCTLRCTDQMIELESSVVSMLKDDVRPRGLFRRGPIGRFKPNRSYYKLAEQEEPSK
eukprot:TRINITY_DN6418_c0_g1_i1.p2 TRINITY_DN6418_c0_g1~~TRINITY_DN6418_c0_g1_i1.p2  ORF type:complete len:115 (-),score=9.68 TRINITY_DN6418_c0_g1_i1:92-436(-)